MYITGLADLEDLQFICYNIVMLYFKFISIVFFTGCYLYSFISVGFCNSFSLSPKSNFTSPNESNVYTSIYTDVKDPYRHRAYGEYLYRLKTMVQRQTPNPVVYYYGIGGVKARHALGYQDIDIISPLLSTDFSLLIASDFGSIDFETFKLAVRKETNKLGINFDEVSFVKKNRDLFEVSFTFQGKKRVMRIYYNVDSTKKIKGDLRGELDSLEGLDVLYTRGIPFVYKKMRRRTKAYLFSKVKPQGFAIMEISPEFKQGWRGFDKLDYPKLNTPVNQQTMELFERIQILQKREMVRKKGFFRRGRSKKDITDSHINISA